jgi:hypothetical protein
MMNYFFTEPKPHILNNQEMLLKLLYNSNGTAKSDVKYEYTVARVLASIEDMKPENKKMKFVEIVNALVDDDNPSAHSRADCIFGLDRLPEDQWEDCLRRKRERK